MFGLSKISIVFIHLCIYNAVFGDELKDAISDLLPDRDVCGMQPGDRIIGGKVTSLGEFAWMALLLTKSPSGALGFICGGSLINSRYVVTSAHCIKDKLDKDLTFVLLGEHDITKHRDCEEDEPGPEFCSEDPRLIESEENIIYEGYNENSRIGDIALLRLKEEVKYTDFIKPICLPLSGELRSRDFVKEKLIAAGWGATEKGLSSNIKLKVQVPVVPRNNCSTIIGKHLQLTIADSQICAGGEKGKDSCQGDSGGPLMYVDIQGDKGNFILCGVVSYGYKCGLEDVPGVYTKVGSYVEWIVKNLKP